MTNLIYNVLFALIVAVAGIIARELLPYLKKKQAELDATIRRTQWSWAADIVDAVVRAVEQTVSQEVHGEGKKDIALHYIQRILKENGIELTDDQIDALIEAAVHAMNENYIRIDAPEEVTVDE
jgi:LL-H family phage holin